VLEEVGELGRAGVALLALVVAAFVLLRWLR
jgi:hypothetical protein